MHSKNLNQKVTELAQLVGNTPIRKIRINDDRFLYLKEEGQNPAGSIKDRPAFNMLFRAIKSNLITPDTVVAESTSGNTGIGLAWVCSELGLEYHNYSPKSLSVQKQAILNGYGAKLFFADGGTDEATKLLSATIEANPGIYFWPSQFTNDNNWRAHVEQTTPELLRQLPETNEVWVGFGSGGTSTGFAHALKGTSVALGVVQNTLDREKRIEGMRNLAWISKPPIADLDMIGPQNMYNTDPDTLLALAQRIYTENEGFIVGPTTAAIMTQAVKSQAPHVVVISPDNGNRYSDWVRQVAI
ncbi:MAG: cysteine synthase [Cellvibrionaceae bacterium]|jgi:cysteine synthase